MKIKFLITGLLGLITAAAFAQKSAVSDANDAYVKYSSLKGNKAMGAIAMISLKTAKESIDKASTNAKTSGDALTYALKGAIYSSLAFNDTVTATSTPNFATAEEAYKKAKELDTKGDNKKLLDDAALNLANYKLNQGVKEYSSKRYDLAYKSFDYSRQLMNDTTSIYYAGLAAANANNWDGAIENFNRLLTTDYKRKETIYSDLYNFYFDKKDTVNAIRVINEAIKLYPKNPQFSKRLIELNLQTGHQAEVLAQIETTIANDPKNKTLYYYAAMTYTQVANEAGNKVDALAKQAAKAAAAAKPTTATPPAKPGTKPTPPPAATPAPAASQALTDQIAALSKTRDDYYAKAEAADRKALEIDPNYFEANQNLGFVLISPAIDIFNATRNLPVSKQKEYDAGMAKSGAMFDIAKPYIMKAVELNPKSVEALINLRTYYQGKNDLTHANEVKKQIDALNGAAPAAPAN